MLVALPARSWAAPVLTGYWDGTTASLNAQTGTTWTIKSDTYTDLGNMNCTGNCDAGVIGYSTDANNLYVMFAQQTSVNDNTYGTNASAGWSQVNGGMGHQLSDLLGSDKAEFTLSSGATTVWDGYIDYATLSGGKYVSLGVGSGGDGSFVGGTSTAAALTQSVTSLKYDLNGASTNNTCSATTNSPVVGSPEPDVATNRTTGCGNWVTPTVYELAFSKAALSPTLFDASGNFIGTLDVSTVHNSPSRAWIRICATRRSSPRHSVAAGVA